MAVIAVDVKSITMATAIEDGRLVRDYRVTYRIRADEFTRDPIAIITSGHPLLPNVFSTYAFFGSVDTWARFVRDGSLSRPRGRNTQESGKPLLSFRRGRSAI
ncbi:MAG: hypothetical protein KatS3mg038_1529 [Candidatus Kapaibacterium sp.]|nr:MAG: hypothetical protein KatS3mg038_1529 [Candidatus Kapabacteria bacterium]